MDVLVSVDSKGNMKMGGEGAQRWEVRPLRHIMQEA
jgi:hypothetical protein